MLTTQRLKTNYPVDNTPTWLILSDKPRWQFEQYKLLKSHTSTCLKSTQSAHLLQRLSCKFCLALGLILFVNHVAFADIALTPYQAEYRVTYHGWPAGTSKQCLEYLKNNHYRFSNNIQPSLGFIPYSDYEVSIFNFEGGNIHPKRYWNKKNEAGKRTESLITFNWKSQQAQSRVNDEILSLPIDIDAQDKQTYMLKLRQDVIQQKKILVYTIIGDNKVRRYEFKRLGEEIINTDLGPIKALKLEQINKEKKRLTHLWLAPKYNYLLIKLDQYREGKRIGDAILVSTTEPVKLSPQALSSDKETEILPKPVNKPSADYIATYKKW